MKEFKFIQAISIRVILLFGVAFFGTYLSDYISSIDGFGDYKTIVYHSKYLVEEQNYPTSEEIKLYGTRHIWYSVGVIVLFLLQLISLIWFVVNRAKTINDEKAT